MSLFFPEFFTMGKMYKPGLKTGGHHAIFSVLEVKISKILQEFYKIDWFCLHS